MRDAIAEMLAERHHLDDGAAVGATASALAHVAVAALLLIGLGSRSVVPLTVAPIATLPIGELLGFPAPAAAGGSNSPPPVLVKPIHRPSTAAAVQADRPHPNASVQRMVADSTSSGAAPGGRGPDILFGDPSGASSPNSWYLAGVQAKVWSLWSSQPRPRLATPLEVRFRILKDGTVADAVVAVPSGDPLLDLAAVRAVTSGAPFATLPTTVLGESLTIRACFKVEQ